MPKLPHEIAAKGFQAEADAYGNIIIVIMIIALT